MPWLILGSAKGLLFGSVGRLAGHECGQLGSAVHVELAVNVSQVGLHRAPTHEESLADLGVCQPLDSELDYLPLGGGETVLP